MSESARKGAHTFYPLKSREVTSINLTPEAHAKMAEAKAATGASRVDLIEHGFRKLVGLPVNEQLEASLALMTAVSMQASS